jgi:hypothetical protein
VDGFQGNIFQEPFKKGQGELYWRPIYEILGKADSKEGKNFLKKLNKRLLLSRGSKGRRAKKLKKAVLTGRFV